MTTCVVAQIEPAEVLLFSLTTLIPPPISPVTMCPDTTSRSSHRIDTRRAWPPSTRSFFLSNNQQTPNVLNAGTRANIKSPL